MRRDWAKLFGKQLAKLRRLKGMKQHKLEETIGSGPQYVSHLETGRSKPSFDNIFEIAEALDGPAMDLFFVPTIGFKLLYGFMIVRLDRRYLVWISVTTNPTAEWHAR